MIGTHGAMAGGAVSRPGAGRCCAELEEFSQVFDSPGSKRGPGAPACDVDAAPRRWARSLLAQRACSRPRPRPQPGRRQVAPWPTAPGADKWPRTGAVAGDSGIEGCRLTRASAPRFRQAGNGTPRVIRLAAVGVHHGVVPMRGCPGRGRPRAHRARRARTGLASMVSTMPGRRMRLAGRTPMVAPESGSCARAPHGLPGST